MILNTERSQENQLIRNLAGSLMLPQSLDQGLSTNANAASTQQYVGSTSQCSMLLPAQSPSISSVSNSVAGTSSSLLARRHSMYGDSTGIDLSGSASSLHIRDETQTCNVNVRRFSCMR